MVNSKTDGGGEAHSNVEENGEGLVKEDVGVSGPMGEIVDKDMTCVSDGPAEYIKYQREYGPMRILN